MDLNFRKIVIFINPTIIFEQRLSTQLQNYFFRLPLDLLVFSCNFVGAVSKVNIQVKNTFYENFF